MAANFSTVTPVPNLTTAYTDVLTILNDKFTDLVKGLDPATAAPINLPANAIVWSSTASKWQKYNGSGYTDLASTYEITTRSAVNLSAGGAGHIPYQSASGTTSYLAAGTAGQAFISGGAGAPSWGTLSIAAGGTGATTQAQALINLGERTSSTGSVKLTSGTTAQRDSTPSAGYIRYNTDIVQFEGYNGTNWTAVGGGARGGGSNQVFYENDAVVTTNYTITAGKNAVSAGPITIGDGIVVSVPNNSSWSIV